MNRKFQALVGIAMCALTFAACKKDHLPSSEETMAAKANGNANFIQPAPTYTLVRRGTDSLYYYEDGRLGKVIHQFGYTQYNYGFNTVIAKNYGNGLLQHEDIYQIDVATGRAYEQESKGYTHTTSGYILTTKVYKFEYNAQGSLSKKYKKDAPNERQVFTYAPGNILTVKSYSSANQLIATYTFVTGSTPNKLNLFVEKQGIDMFLPIFGKAIKDMPEHQSCKLANGFTTFDEWMTYDVNSDGHITNVNRFDGLKNQQMTPVVFRYKSVRHN
jgi:hypothetical protein